jgi:hypothetical protein
MLQEEKTDTLLKALYGKDSLNSYDFCAEQWGNDEGLPGCKAIADELVDAKLAKYKDEQKTELMITNFGRYWIIKGGFLIFLKEGDKKIKPHYSKENCNGDDTSNHHLEELNEELKEARLKFTNYRIVTYWWSFALTLISFFLSLLSLYLVLKKN